MHVICLLSSACFNGQVKMDKQEISWHVNRGRSLVKTYVGLMSTRPYVEGVTRPTRYGHQPHPHEILPDPIPIKSAVILVLTS